MKKCKGCGSILQTNNPDELGYVVDINQDYCKRCFRLSHYGDISNFKNNSITNEKIINIYGKYPNALFVVIIDIIDALVIDQDDLLDIFKDYNCILVINKTDIMPSNMTDDKLEHIFSKKLFSLNKKYKNIKSAILTNKHETAFNEQLLSIFNELNHKTIVFAGRANAGKSSLINKLLHNNSITTSMYPGTTMDEIEIYYNNYIFIDTPGLVDINNYSTYESLQKYKLAKLDTTIKPQVFQVRDEQSYFYEGLIRVDVKAKENCSITFFINNNNEIHRTKLENADEYYEKHYKDFKLKVSPLKINNYNIEDYKLFIIKGLGLLKVNGKCTIDIHYLSNVKLYESEILI